MINLLYGYLYKFIGSYSRSDSNRHWKDFLTTTSFLALSVCGLDYTFTIPFGLGAPHLVSTPSSCDAWLGIAILQVSPNLRSYTHKVSQMRLNFT